MIRIRTILPLAALAALVLTLASPSLAQGPRRGGGAGGAGMMGSGGGGPMGGGAGGGMGGGQGQQLTEPEDATNEVQCLKFALDCVKAAISTYNEGNPQEQGGGMGGGGKAGSGPMGGGSGGGMGGGQQQEPCPTDDPSIPGSDSTHAFKKELYQTLWQLYDEIGQVFRMRDQFQEATSVYEEAMGYMPKPPNVRSFGGGGGGAGGGAGGGPGGGPGGPMGGGGGPMGSGGGGNMAGGPMGSGGGGMGGQSQGQADDWKKLPPDMTGLLINDILPNVYYRLAEVYYESHRLTDAWDVVYTNVANPTDHINVLHGPSWVMLGQLDLLLGRDERAAADTSNAVRLSGSASAGPLVNYGIAWARVGQGLDALVAFRAALAQPLTQDPRDYEAHCVAHNYIGVQEIERKNYEAADDSFRQITKLLPGWDSLVAKEKRYSVFRDEQRRLLSATVIAYSNLGIVAAKRGRVDDAVALQRAATQAADLLVRLEQADEGASVGDMDRAMAVADAAYRNAAVALDSRGAKNQHKAHGEVDLGGSHADYTTSVEYLQRAVAAAPQDAAAWNSLGLAFYRLRRFYEAESAFEEAVRLSGESKDYHANLQAARERLGDKPHDPRIR